MTQLTGNKRTDSGSRVIQAPREAIYQAYLDPEAVMAWRPPEGMRARVFAFDARVGGKYRMAFEYTAPAHAGLGKTSENLDCFEGEFVELVPNERIVERVVFESDDPAFAGEMTVITTLAEVPGGTEVTIRCENVPHGISASDHEAGLKSTLQNLAAFTE